jgi:hypothetical protein
MLDGVDLDRAVRAGGVHGDDPRGRLAGVSRRQREVMPGGQAGPLLVGADAPRSRFLSSGAPSVDQAGFVCHYDGLDPIAQAELHQDPSDMGLDGCLADVEPGGDLPV